MTKSRQADVYDEDGKRVSATSAYAQRFGDLVDASRTVGHTPASQLAWVTKFIAEDPSRWNERTERSHANCLTVLATAIIPEFVHGGFRLPPTLDSEEVREIHQLLKNTLTAAVDASVGVPIVIPTEGLTMALVRASEKGKKPAIWGVTYGGRADTAVVRSVVDLIRSPAGDRLIACKYCGNPIVSVKKQLFCNPFEAQKDRNSKRKPRPVEETRHGKPTRKR